MDNVEQPLEEQIAQRLLTSVEGARPNPASTQAKRKRPQALTSGPTLVEKSEESDLPSAKDFAKIERNFASLGFFTPSSKRIRNLKGKEISFKREIDGKQIEVKTTISPSAMYGLPITADQDKYIALQKIITHILREDGELKNPITFTTAEILKILGLSDAGEHYKEIEEWLKVMTGTMIVSKGTVYLRGQKKWARDMFHVFDRAVAVGKELPDGTIADRNYVWLSQWQLENINYKWLIPVDLEAYRKLKSHIAKALVPLLQIWFFASREKGSFEKRYGELCELLNIRKYKKLSDIKKGFVPALEELRWHGYLAEWRIERTWDRKDFKVVLVPGSRFSEEQQQRISSADRGETGLVVLAGGGVDPTKSATEDSESTEQLPDEPVVELRVTALTARGVSEKQARRVLAGVAGDQPVLDQLEWGDHVIKGDPQKIQNPAGFYLSLIRDNIAVPETFETTIKRRQRQAASAALVADEQAQAHILDAYNAYQAAEVDRYLAALDPAALNERLLAERNDILRQYKNLSHLKEEHLSRFATIRLRSKVAKELPLQTFLAFCEVYKREHPGNAAAAA